MYTNAFKLRMRFLRSSWIARLKRTMFKVTNCIVVLVQIYVAKGMHRLKEVRVRTEHSFRWWRGVDAVGSAALRLCEPTEAVACMVIIWRLPGFIS